MPHACQLPPSACALLNPRLLRRCPCRYRYHDLLSVGGALTFDSTKYTVYADAYKYGPTALTSPTLPGQTLDFFAFAQDPGGNISPNFSIVVAEGGNQVIDDFFGPLLAGNGAAPVFINGIYNISKFDEYDNGTLIASAESGKITITGGENPPTTSATPEPSSLMLLATGLAGAAGVIRKRISQC